MVRPFEDPVQTLDVAALCGGLGKLPSQADFLLTLAADKEQAAMNTLHVLERWLVEGMHHAARSCGDEFPHLYEKHLLHRFIFRADNIGQAVVGVVRAEQDAIGRQFPFVTFALRPTQELDRDPSQIPMLGDLVFGQLEATIATVEQIADRQKIYQVLQTEWTWPAVASSTIARYGTFLEEVECQELGGEHLLSGLALIDVLYAALRQGGVDPRHFPFFLELPLSQPVYTRSLEIRFWLDLIRSLCPRPLTLSLFWRGGSVATSQVNSSSNRLFDRPPAADGLLISFRQPSSLILPALLRPGQQSPGLWRPGDGEPLPSSLRIRHVDNIPKDLLTNQKSPLQASSSLSDLLSCVRYHDK